MSDRQTTTCIQCARAVHRSGQDELMPIAIYWLLLALLSQDASVNVSEAIDLALRADG